MNSVYESLRALLRNKELEIKKLEKEIEALRIVLPIVAEAGEGSMEVSPENGAKPKTFPVPDFNAVLSQAKPTPIPDRPNPPAEINSKPRTSWP
jgi:hypothetical protein